MVNYLYSMKTIRLIGGIVILLLSYAANAQTAAGEKKTEALVWYTDLVKANDAAKTANKPIFALFTGSDWCVWCRKLQNDVLAKPEFVKWAKENVILLEVDFPRYKQLPAEQAQQNQGLQQTFSVPGFPTIWVFNMNKDDKTEKYNITTLGSLGYPQGAESGKEEVKFLKDANAVIAATGKK